MGWWKIDRATGQPIAGEHSALSRPPELVLPNAVPSVDDDEADCYLGDGPGDMGSGLPAEFEAAIGDGRSLTDQQLRDCLLGRVVPQSLADRRPQLLQLVEAFWLDIDGCYEDEWGRPARPAEKRWICEDVIERRRHK
ncbi:MAG TPA: hypothetical protein VFB80_00190 [Pirellulaceae bacterium]|nr:hypothetical protein [Pirellulaceae bacterium]